MQAETNISSLIQLSVAPVFLIAGVAALINIFTGRLARIVDRLEKLDSIIVKRQQKDPNYQPNEHIIQRREFLTTRMQNINISIFLSTSTVFMIAIVILSIFATSLLDFDAHILISMSFIISMVCLSIALLIFLKEIHNTTSFIKNKKKGYNYEAE